MLRDSVPRASFAIAPGSAVIVRHASAAWPLDRQLEGPAQCWAQPPPVNSGRLSVAAEAVAACAGRAGRAGVDPAVAAAVDGAAGEAEGAAAAAVVVVAVVAAAVAAVVAPSSPAVMARSVIA